MGGMIPSAAMQNTEVTPTFREAFAFWVKLGFINFGGPAGQIAIMHRELVDQKRWVSETLFLRGLNFATLLPGPEAQQLATYIGWWMHGTRGGIVAGSFFVIPSIFVMLGLSWLAAVGATVPAIAGLLYGIQCVVTAIVVEAVIRVGRRALRTGFLYVVAALAFVGLFFAHLPFPQVVLGAAALGILVYQRWPSAIRASAYGAAGALDAEPAAALPSAARIFRVAAIFLVLWLVPVGALWLWRGGGDVLVHEALFFTQVAFVTFGGAYAVLSYIADVAVNVYGWLDARQMVQGLGLAESTPGPLIMVTQYVGFLGAWNLHGDLDPLVAGTLGALVTTYVIFLPCFLFVFAGAPYMEALSRNARLQASLTTVTAAVVGVILNLAVFFGLQVLFPGGAPDLFALALGVLAYLALWRLKWPVYVLVPLGALAGIAWTLRP
jgi:chromate transporter